jgi:hypothetical protein
MKQKKKTPARRQPSEGKQDPDDKEPCPCILPHGRGKDKEETMPKVFLTNEQKLEARNAEMRHRIAYGLCVTKNRTKMSMEEIAEQAGVGRMTVSHLLCGDDVEIKLSSLIRLLDLAGLVIRPRTEEKL